MTSSMLCFNESLQHAARWGTRTVTVSGSGTTTGTLPATNIWTPNPNQVFERTGILSGDSVVLDVRLVNATNGVVPLANSGMVWGFLNVLALNETTGDATDLTIRVRESSTAFTGPYQYDRSHLVTLRGQFGPVVRQTWIPRGVVSTAVAQSNGGDSAPGWTRITFTATPGVDWTLRVGRIAFMSGLACRIEPTVSRGGRDLSEVVRSFSGYPYALAGARTRQFSGTMRGLSDRQVRGDLQIGQTFLPSVQAINAMSGVGSEVCIIERLTDAATSSNWQQQPVFGLLEQPLQARRVANTADGAGLSDCEVEVAEIPFG